MKRLLTGVLVGLLVYGFILNWSMVFAADLYVESSGSCGGKAPCYSTIQQAINAANSGDTIKLAQGIYAETFVLDSGKQLILPGGWDAGFTEQTPRTTAIRAPIVTKGAIAFQELRIMEIAGPMGNATIADVLEGKTFSSDAGTGLTGIMVNRAGLSYTPTTTDQPIATGYYNGSGKVVGDADLVSGNIKSGVTIFGVAGNSNVVDTSSGDAAAGDILSGKKAWVDGVEVTGNVDAGSNVSGADGLKIFSIPDGLYSGSKTATANDAQLVSGNIKSGVDIFSVAGDSNVVDTTSGDAAAGEILQGKKAWVDGGEVTGERHGGCTCTDTLYENRWCDNGNGTVTDLTACLVWLQKADWGGLKLWRNSSTDCSYPSYTCYDDAHTRAGLLKAADYAWLSDGSVEGDWRLPTKTELDGLVNGTPTLRCPTGSCNLYAFTGVQSSFYWSSSTFAGMPSGAWGVHLGDDSVHGGLKDFVLGYVWPVRSGN